MKEKKTDATEEFRSDTEKMSLDENPSWLFFFSYLVYSF